MKFREIKTLALAAALAMLNACTVGPDYQRPDVVVPVAYKEAPGWKRAEPRASSPRGPWWQVFGDDELDALASQVEVSNQNVQLAEAQVRQALALVRASRAPLFPSVDAGASVTRSRAPGVVNTGNQGRTSTTRNIQVDLSWEIDLWGRLRRGVEASEARIRAPRAVQPGSIDPASSRKPSKARWPVLVLAIGCAAAAIAYWTMPQPVTVPVSAPAPAPAPVMAPAPAPATAPASVPVTAPASGQATVTAPAPVSVPAPATGSDAAAGAGEAPIPNPNAIFPETGALDTYDAQLALARRLKRGSRAAAAYRRAIELNPASSPALAELARLMLARNHTREAAELAERATALDPTNALAWVTLGASRQARGDRQGARQAYQNCATHGKGQYVSECRAMLR